MNIAFLAFLVYAIFSLRSRFIVDRSGSESDVMTTLFASSLVKILIGVILLYVIYQIIILSLKVIKNRNRKLKLRDSGIYRIDRMTGTEFEEYLTVFFENLGYKVEEIGGKGDKGADRLLTDSKSGKRICVQAKCWAKNVTFEAVQQVFTARTLYNCQEAWIITNRGFTKQVRQTADKLGIELWDRERLIDNMYVYRKNEKKQNDGTTKQLFLASPGSEVFHDLKCKHGRSLLNRPDILKYDSYNEAMESGKRKCNCYK